MKERGGVFGGLWGKRAKFSNVTSWECIYYWVPFFLQGCGSGGQNQSGPPGRRGILADA